MHAISDFKINFPKNFNEEESLSSHSNQFLDQTRMEKPHWLSLKRFYAPSTVLEKVSRAANVLTCGAAIYGCYALSNGLQGFFPYASYVSMGLVLRKMMAATIGYLVYPAALSSLSFGREKNIEKQEKSQIKLLEDQAFIVRKIFLIKSGIKYDAVLITHPTTIKNGQWVINALGNNMKMEFSIAAFAKENFARKCNTLLVNGPSVGLSGGWPTRYQMGAGFEAGITFLEQEVKATHIIMCGLSLGAGMLAEAVLNHDFTAGMKKNIRYLMISDRTFSRLSTIAIAYAGRLAKLAFYLSGMELDGLGAAKKLSQLGIRQIIIQHSSLNDQGNDSVIPDKVSLACALRKEKLVEKVYLESKSIDHNDFLPKNISEGLSRQIEIFLSTPK